MTPLLALASVPLHSFDNVGVWQPNADGGNAPQVRADPTLARDGPAMRVVYGDRPPHWGNLTGPCTVPPEARALTLWVYRHRAARAAALHIWLFEPDGDAWVSQVRFDGKMLADAPAGYNRVRLPVARFDFQPRGPGTRQMTAVTRMLIGCNFGDLEVTLADMSWDTDPARDALPLPRTAVLKAEDGPAGRLAILDLNPLPPGFRLTHSPARLAAVARGGGYGVTLLQSGDLADPAVLTRDRFDAVILPWGPWFPQQGRDAFLAYLKAGGSFLSTDGYAFDHLAVLTADGWSPVAPERAAADMGTPGFDPGQRVMNTRTGKPGDALTLSPEQIGVFDPGFMLHHATALRVSEEWSGRLGGDPAVRQSVAAPVSGYAACGLIGVNGAVFPDVYRRYLPVLNAWSSGASATLRGPALAVMHNFAGVFRGSSWAFSGLTDGSDLLLATPERERLLLQVLREITSKVYLHGLATEYASYEPGETVALSVRASNFGRAPATRTCTVEVAGRPVGSESFTLAPGETKALRMEFASRDLAGDLCTVRASLATPGTDLCDRLETAFCLRSPRVLAAGPRLAWRDNTMTVDGRPTFMVGSNQTGMMYYSAHEGPQTWDRDFRNMAAHNFHLLRILHFSPFSKDGYGGKRGETPLDLATRPVKLIRQMDAIVQLAQKHRVAIFLSLHDWMGISLTDEELAAQADWNRFWAARYRDVPGVFYDVQNEPSVGVPDRPDIVALWNRFLQARYGSDEALRSAWQTTPPEAALPNVPLGKPSADWGDVRTADRKRFEAELLNRWVKANVDGIRAGNPGALVCVGYLGYMAPADRLLGVRHTDFSNMHYYGSVDGFPLEFALADRRCVGKGLSLGECGAQENHDRRNAGEDGLATEDSIYRFRTYSHYAPAMGAAFILNWCWKDFDESIFPWGLMPLNADVPKPWLLTWQQDSLLLGLLQPAWQPPQVFILAPDRHRIGPRFEELNNGIRRCVELLLEQRVNFAMANEEDLDSLPTSARALFWPLPYCPDDATFDRVRAWVQAGGTLYLSGTVAFDASRRPTRVSRLADLGLPAVEPALPFATPEATWSQAPIEAACGKGRVLLAPYPLELRAQGSDSAVYRRALDLAGVDRIVVEPADAPVRALSIPTADGGRLTMLARRSAGAELITVGLPAARTTVQLAERGFALIRVGPKGEVLAAESQGTIRVGGVAIATAGGHYGVCALDGRDLATSTRLLVLPHRCEEVRLLRDVAGMAAIVTPPAAEAGGVTQQQPALLTFPAGAPGQVAVLAPPSDLPAARKVVRDAMGLRFAP